MNTSSDIIKHNDDWISSISSILTDTESIVEHCQEMELQPNLSFQTLDTVLVTQLAALIHLKEYTRAKHLWRRYSSLVHDGMTHHDDDNNKTHHPSHPLPQFVTLWRALTPLIRFHAKGYSLRRSGLNLVSNDDEEMMRIATIYELLQQCITIGEIKLSEYARELQYSIRDAMANTIERVYEVINMEHCKSLLGFSSSCLYPPEKAIQQQQQQEQQMEEYLLKERHWTFESSSGSWIPRYNPVVKNGKEELFGTGGGDSRIKFLTKYSEFLERQRLNA